MQYGLSLPTGGECGDPRFLVDLAERAEAAGWDGLFLEDYVCYGGDRTTPTCNVWAVLSAVAVRTRRMRLGTEVTPLTRRRPWNVAREAAAVDQLSGGRMVLGVGLGDTGEAINADASYLSFGEERDARTRGEMLDEGLEIVAGLWDRRAVQLPRQALPGRRRDVPAAPGAASAHPDLDRRRVSESATDAPGAAMGWFLSLQGDPWRPVGGYVSGRRARPPRSCRRSPVHDRRRRKWAP